MDIFRTKSAEDMAETSEHSQLKKNLTAWDLAMFGIGSVVGVGVFVATGKGALEAGPGVILSYIIAGICCGFCALTYSELAAMFPVAGSTYSYTYVAFGELIAWIVGWDLMLEYLVAGSAVASGWSGAFNGLVKTIGINLPNALTNAPISDTSGVFALTGCILDLPAVLISFFVTWLLFVGIKESARFNNVIVALKLAVIVLFIALGASHVKLSNLVPMMPNGWTGVMSGAAIIFFSYIGFDAVSTAAEETKNPKRDVPLGLMICLGTATVLYILCALVLTGIVPWKEIDVQNALPASLTRIGIHWGSALVATGAIVGMVSTLLVTVYGQIRIFMVMSRDGLLPKAFSTIHPVHQTPHICTWITGVVTAAIAGLLPLNAILELANIGTLFAFVLVSVGVVVLRRTKPNIERKFKCPGVPYTPLITVAYCLYLMYFLPIMTWIRFSVWLAIGLALYFVYGASHSALANRTPGRA